MPDLPCRGDTAIRAVSYTTKAPRSERQTTADRRHGEDYRPPPGDAGSTLAAVAVVCGREPAVGASGE